MYKTILLALGILVSTPMYGGPIEDMAELWQNKNKDAIVEMFAPIATIGTLRVSRD